MARIPADHLVHVVVFSVACLGGNPGVYAEDSAPSERAPGIDLHYSFWCYRRVGRRAYPLATGTAPVSVQIQIAARSHKQRTHRVHHDDKTDAFQHTFHRLSGLARSTHAETFPAR